MDATEKMAVLIFQRGKQSTVHLWQGSMTWVPHFKVLLKLRSTWAETDDRVIRDGAYNLSVTVLDFL